MDSKSFNFISYKSAGYHLRKRNPRMIAWTQVYRKLHKNQSVDEQKKKTRRRVVKVARSYQGASLEAIRAKRTTVPATKPAAAGAKARTAKVSSVKKAQKSQKLKAVMATQKSAAPANRGGATGATKKGR